MRRAHIIPQVRIVPACTARMYMETLQPSGASNGTGARAQTPRFKPLQALQACVKNSGGDIA